MSDTAQPAASSTRKQRDRSNPLSRLPKVESNAAAHAVIPRSTEPFRMVEPSTPKGRETVRKVLLATVDVLVDHGYAGLTLRLAGQRAGVSHGNVQYYFSSKDVLIQNLIVHLADSYRSRIVEIEDSFADSPLDRLTRTTQIFINENSTYRYSVIYSELRTLALRNDFVNDILDHDYTQYRLYLEGLLRAVNPDLPASSIVLRAAAIVSLIEGLAIFLGGKNTRHAELADLSLEVEWQILQIASAPARVGATGPQSDP